jgi:hypothetical protein
MLVNIRDWQQKFELARVADQRALSDRLSGLERSQTSLLEALGERFSLAKPLSH